MSTIKKLEIIYHNGQPDGIRSIQRKASVLTTYVIPRSLLSEAKKITDITRPGIYYLINEDDVNKIAQIYVGQTVNGILRLDDHNRNKPFWNKAIMFLSDSKMFSLDMLSGLEKYAINKAHESKRYKVENSNNPKYKIDEYDLPVIEEIYNEIQFVMASLGYKMDNAKFNKSETDIFQTTRNGIIAYGVYKSEKFEVLDGSQIDIKSKSSARQKLLIQRQNAVKNGDIVEEGGKFILKVSISFSSPSAAAEFVLGYAANGWVEWKNKEGKTLDEIYRK